MKNKKMPVVFVALGLGALATIFMSRFLAQPGEEAAVSNDVGVLVAKQEIPSYMALTEPSWFEIKSFPKSEVNKDAVDSFEKIRGRMLKSTMHKDRPLNESDLLPPGTEPLVARLNKGERLMSIKVTPDNAAAGFVLPNSKVDVVAVQMRSDEKEGGPVARTILQDVEVLAIDQQHTLPDGTIAKQADRVTLRVTLEQAELLSVFADTGSLRLVPRRPDDDEKIESKGATTSQKKNRASQLTDLIPKVPFVPKVEVKPDAPKPFVLTIMDGKMKSFEFPAEAAGLAPPKPGSEPIQDRRPAPEPERTLKGTY